MALLETVFQYRTLIGRCELGLGLEFDDITRVGVIESHYAGARSRRFRREAVHHEAVLRGDRLSDRVRVVELGPGGLACAGAPYVAQGEIAELAIEIADCSYRFRVRAVWLKEDGDDYRVGFAFEGVPVQLRRGAIQAALAA